MACAVADAVPVEVHEKPVGAPDGFSPDHIGRAPTFLVCDVPWLHPEVAAIVALNGQMLVRCPYCGKEHRHGGFGHRLAHCDKPAGRGYVLIPTVEGVAVSSGAWS